jgi:hypothetical protein
MNLYGRDYSHIAGPFLWTIGTILSLLEIIFLRPWFYPEGCKPMHRSFSKRHFVWPHPPETLSSHPWYLRWLDLEVYFRNVPVSRGIGVVKLCYYIIRDARVIIYIAVLPVRSLLVKFTHSFFAVTQYKDDEKFRMLCSIIWIIPVVSVNRQNTMSSFIDCFIFKFESLN